MRARKIARDEKLICQYLRGGIFLILVYFVAMLVIMPMLGQGFFLSSAPKAMVAFVGHVVFGLSMGAIIGEPSNP